jgi:hypothetical protein
LIIVSTLDFLFRERPLGSDLARRQVNDQLQGFGTPVAKVHVSRAVTASR